MKPLPKLTKKQKLMLLICGGIIVLLLFMPLDQKMFQTSDQKTQTQSKSTSTTSEVSSVEAFEKTQEKRLKAVIEKMEGVGNVYVMITASTSTERVIEKEVATSSEQVSESDASGGTRNSLSQNTSENAVYEQNGQTPYVIKEIQPVIEGVVVAAEGADTPQVVKEITETVAALFDVPVHKIKVVKME